MRVATTAPLLAAALLLLCAGTPQTQALVPFPMPRSMTQGDGSTPVNVSALFAFACDTTAGCDQVACSSSAITTAAMTRFEALIRPNQAPLGVGSRTPNGDALSSATVCIVDDNEYLGQTTDETYTLTVPTSGGVAAIKANTVFGAMHAMESLAQVADTTTSEHTIANAPISIDDGPRFGYRGLLVDTARHFLPMDHLKHVVDGLSASKLNVMHWHIVDAQSFAYGSTKFPQLAEKGAYSSQAIFSPAAIADLVQYAKMRGVRIMPEWDVPGHGRWGAGIPSLMGCDIVMDPTNPYVYEFLTQFLQEAEGIFEEDIFFLGGDEVDSSCWEQNPAIAKWLTAHNMTASQLQQYFWQQVGSKVLPNINKTISIWEADALQIDPKSVPNGTIANVYQSLPTADKTVAAGMPTVVSIAGDHWYLDSECGGYNQNAWQCIYKVEPLSPYTKQHTDLFLGGETAMWGEGINHHNFDSFVWRGAAAGGERLWSPANVTDIASAEARMVEHSCRLGMRGIHMGPVAPSFCPADL